MGKRRFLKPGAPDGRCFERFPRLHATDLHLQPMTTPRIVGYRLRGLYLNQLELSDFDIDHQLLELPGISLLVFTGVGCASCRYARQQLPGLALEIEQVCWIDAEENGGAVARYEVFHLPALFVVRDGQFYGVLRSPLNQDALQQALRLALLTEPQELP